MYFEDADESLDADVPVANKIVLSVSVLVILLFFLGLGPLLDSANFAVTTLIVGR